MKQFATLVLVPFFSVLLSHFPLTAQAQAPLVQSEQSSYLWTPATPPSDCQNINAEIILLDISGSMKKMFPQIKEQIVEVLNSSTSRCQYFIIGTFGTTADVLGDAFGLETEKLITQVNNLEATHKYTNYDEAAKLIELLLLQIKQKYPQPSEFNINLSIVSDGKPDNLPEKSKEFDFDEFLASKKQEFGKITWVIVKEDKSLPDFQDIIRQPQPPEDEEKHEETNEERDKKKDEKIEVIVDIQKPVNIVFWASFFTAASLAGIVAIIWYFKSYNLEGKNTEQQEDNPPYYASISENTEEVKTPFPQLLHIAEISANSFPIKQEHRDIYPGIELYFGSGSTSNYVIDDVPECLFVLEVTDTHLYLTSEDSELTCNDKELKKEMKFPLLEKLTIQWRQRRWEILPSIKKEGNSTGPKVKEIIEQEAIGES